eukprot:1407279-Pleurochrysis_carterae.AAC.1
MRRALILLCIRSDHINGAYNCIHCRTPGYRLKAIERLRKGKLIITTRSSTVFPLRAGEYKPPEDDLDGPSIDKDIVMVNVDNKDDVPAASGVAAGKDADSDGDNAALAAGMDDSIASRVRHHEAPKPTKVSKVGNIVYMYVHPTAERKG